MNVIEFAAEFLYIILYTYKGLNSIEKYFF